MALSASVQICKCITPRCIFQTLQNARTGALVFNRTFTVLSSVRITDPSSVLLAPDLPIANFQTMTSSLSVHSPNPRSIKRFKCPENAYTVPIRFHVAGSVLDFTTSINHCVSCCWMSAFASSSLLRDFATCVGKRV